MAQLSAVAECEAMQQLEQIQYPKRTGQLDHVYELLAAGAYDNAILEATLSIESPSQLDTVELLDIRLRAHVAKSNYRQALDEALAMQNHAPQQYYGYLRAAQIYVVEEDYVNTFQMFHKGFQTVQEDLDDLHNGAATVLGQAISEFASSCRFNDAHILANMLIHLMPTSVVGYLHAGDLYYMEGKGWKALDVYNEGIAEVPAQQPLLMACHAHVQQQLDQYPKHDFMMEFPPEIADNILQRFSLSDLIEAMHVSHDWRKRIQQCSAAWRVLTINGKVDISDITNVRHLVQKIEIQNTGTRDQLLQWLTLVADGEFPKLVALDVKCPQTPPSFSHFSRAFERVKLSYLKLSLRRPHDTVSFHSLLTWCPDLNHLEYEHNSLLPGVRFELFPENPTAITHLSVIYKVRYDEQLLKYFLRLTHLAVQSFYPSTDVSTIIQLCPNLCSLVFGNSGAIGPRAFDNQFKSSRRKGQQFLRVAHASMKLDDIIILISKNHCTLEVLQICLLGSSSLSIQPNDWERFYDIRCPRLKDLQLSIRNDPTYKQWVGDCPALENVLVSDMTNNNGSILDGLKNLPRLRRLDLQACPQLTDIGFTRFFDAISSRPGHPSLRTLSLVGLRVVNDSTLLSVAKVRSIRHLFIRQCEALTCAGVIEFAKRVKHEGGQLEQLLIANMKKASDEVLAQMISALPQLQRLTINYWDGITNEGVRKIAGASKFTKLYSVHIHRCYDIFPQAEHYSSDRLMIRVHT